MLTPNQFALFFTVALLAVTGYFLLGSIPLLILRHDNPVDSSFIRTFYLTYFRLAFIAGMGAAASHAMASRPVFAVAAPVFGHWLDHGQPWAVFVGCAASLVLGVLSAGGVGIMMRRRVA